MDTIELNTVLGGAALVVAIMTVGVALLLHIETQCRSEQKACRECQDNCQRTCGEASQCVEKARAEVTRATHEANGARRSHAAVYHRLEQIATQFESVLETVVSDGQFWNKETIDTIRGQKLIVTSLRARLEYEGAFAKVLSATDKLDQAALWIICERGGREVGEILMHKSIEPGLAESVRAQLVAAASRLSKLDLPA